MIKQTQNYSLIARDYTDISENDINILEEELINGDFDIVATEQLMQHWTNGQVRKHIYFEHSNYIFEKNLFPPPQEAASFSKVRWNPFYGNVILKNTILNKIPNHIINNPDQLLQFSMENCMKIKIVKDTVSIYKPKLTFKNFFSFRTQLKTNRNIYNLFLTTFILYTNLKNLITQYPEYVEYKQQIEKIKKDKKIILELSFAGLGDCLSFSTLPRLLKESYGVDFYLSECSRKAFRNPEVLKLCFELNPYFKGFIDTTTPFAFKVFVHDGDIWRNIIERKKETVLEIVERQFNLKGVGKPEIYYEPKVLPEYSNTLFLDLNWFSGKKWGLYNDPNIVPDIIRKWQTLNPSGKIVYSSPDHQSVFDYIDKLVSANNFITYFSGGNNIAAAYDVPATVIVPENLEGNSLTAFLYQKSKVLYTRKKSLKKYGINIK